MTSVTSQKIIARPAFLPKRQQYASIVSSHLGELDLSDTITLERYQDQPYHEILPIRRYLADQIFPYNTSLLAAWVEKNVTDPVTREDLSYVLPRIRQRKQWLVKYSDIKTKDVTPSFLDTAAREYFNTDIKQSLDLSKSLTDRARAFVDLPTLERIGILFPDLDANSAEQLLLQSNGYLQTHSLRWLIRKSSQHTSTRMPYCDVFTVSFLVPPKVMHFRYILVHGVGVYSIDWTSNITSFSALQQSLQSGAKTVLPPTFLTVIDVLEYWKQCDYSFSELCRRAQQ